MVTCEQLSDQTRSGIVVIETDGSSNTQGPPPIRGTLCEVELRRNSPLDRIVVPLMAVGEQNSVFVLDDDQRLRRREVVVDLEQDDFAAIQSGIVDGEVVIVSQPKSAIDGSLVEPLVDDGPQSVGPVPTGGRTGSTAGGNRPYAATGEEPSE